MRNRRSKVDPITGEPGKWIEGEREADGLVVAMKRRNGCGAKEPYRL
jgi:hypothetical protein